MKISKTLQNEELTEKVLDELESVILSVCEDVVASLNMQLRKGKSFLDIPQQAKLIEHLRGKINLNLTINAGIQQSDLASIDIYPRDMNTKTLDSFIEEKDNAAIDVVSNDVTEEGSDTTMTFSFPQPDGSVKTSAPITLDELGELNDKLTEEAKFREERQKRAEEQA